MRRQKRQKEKPKLYRAEFKNAPQTIKLPLSTGIVGISPDAEYCNNYDGPEGKLHALLQVATGSFKKTLVMVADLPYAVGELAIRFPKPLEETVDTREKLAKQMLDFLQERGSQKTSDFFGEYVVGRELIGKVREKMAIEMGACWQNRNAKTLLKFQDAITITFASELYNNPPEERKENRYKSTHKEFIDRYDKGENLFATIVRAHQEKLHSEGEAPETVIEELDPVAYILDNKIEVGQFITDTTDKQNFDFFIGINVTAKDYWSRQSESVFYKTPFQTKQNASAAFILFEMAILFEKARAYGANFFAYPRSILQSFHASRLVFFHGSELHDSFRWLEVNFKERKAPKHKKVRERRDNPKAEQRGVVVLAEKTFEAFFLNQVKTQITALVEFAKSFKTLPREMQKKLAQSLNLFIQTNGGTNGLFQITVSSVTVEDSEKTPALNKIFTDPNKGPQRLTRAMSNPTLKTSLPINHLRERADSDSALETDDLRVSKSPFTLMPKQHEESDERVSPDKYAHQFDSTELTL